MQDTEVRISDSKGFSVVELLIVMAVAGILMAIGMPSFVDFTRDVRAGSMMSTLTADIQSARSEAVKRNARILFCARATATGNSCTGAPGANVWMNGWLVCYDRDSDGACDASTAAEPNPITVQGAIQAPLAIVGPAANRIMFPTGLRIRTETRQTLLRIAAALTLRDGEQADAEKAAAFAVKLAEEKLIQDREKKEVKA